MTAARLLMENIQHPGSPMQQHVFDVTLYVYPETQRVEINGRLGRILVEDTVRRYMLHTIGNETGEVWQATGNLMREVVLPLRIRLEMEILGLFRTQAGQQLDSFSVAAWVELNSTSTYATALSQDGSNVSAFYLQYKPSSSSNCAGRFGFTLLEADTADVTGAVCAGSSSSPTTNTWYQLTGVYASSRIFSR